MQEKDVAGPPDLSNLHRQLGAVQDQLHTVYEQLATEHGESSMVASRAYEAEAAIQRLRWQLQRQAEPDPELEALYEAVDSHVVRPGSQVEWR